MNITARSLLVVLILMTSAMFYGYVMGTTPDYRATLAMIYGAGVGMVSCVVLLLSIPVFEIIRKNVLSNRQEKHS